MERFCKLKKIICAGLLLALISVAPAFAAKQAVAGQININTATVIELTLLPGIGPSKAAAIVAQRQQKPFAKAEELLLVKGIGDALLAKLMPYLAVSGATTLHPVAVADSSAQSKN